MLVIRLARGGRTKYPVYRIVAAESSRAATGRFVEVLGHYNPHTKELTLDKEQISKRISNGAQPSNSVVKLLQREKIDLPAWVKFETKNRKPKNPPAEPAAAAPATAAAEETSGAAETEVSPEEAPAEAADTESPVEEGAAVAEVATAEEAEKEGAPSAGETETTETAPETA